MAESPIGSPTGQARPNDPYAGFAASPVGQGVVRRLGLPNPTPLRRWKANAPLCDSPVLLAGIGPDGAPAQGVGYTPAIREMLVQHSITRDKASAPAHPTPGGPARLGAVILDLSVIRDPAHLEGLRAVGAPAVKRLARNGRVVVIGTDPNRLSDPTGVATQRALDGIVRSIAKELRAGATANLVYAPSPPGNAPAVAYAVEFLLSGRSAYVDGQTIRVDETPVPTADSTRPDGPDASTAGQKPLDQKVAVVTGAARGIGAAIVAVLARQGATVVGVDVPAAGDALSRVVNAVHGSALQLDVTAPDAGDRILRHCRSRHGGLDIVVHNAGITRDRLFVNLDEAKWGQVIDVNLRSILAMNEVFLGPNGLGAGGRIVCLSSQSGIAGNRGQSNYAATKAALIGLVDALARQVAGRQITVNAVAPGLIETEMTARMPFATREVARRINSLQQGGLPIDVAETIAFLASPGAQAITGQTIRVCGQSMIGA